jgi:cell division septum initiation protein DivIVA
MDTQIGDVRQRSVALIQETGTLLGIIPQLLDRNEALQASLDTAAREADDLRKEVAALRTEAQQLRTEREETADSLTVIMNDILRLTSEAVAKLRGPESRSVFWQKTHLLGGEGTSPRPAPGAGTPWKREG